LFHLKRELAKGETSEAFQLKQTAKCSK